MSVARVKVVLILDLEANPSAPESNLNEAVMFFIRQQISQKLNVGAGILLPAGSGFYVSDTRPISAEVTTDYSRD